MAVTDLLVESEAAPKNIGAILRHAREAAGYSVADVAERMRLSRHHIESLEAERFELFPVSVFLRGYLISYARLLGIDAEPLLEAYDRRGFGPPQLHSQEAASTTTRGSEFTVTIMTLIVIAVLIVLSALWWREQWTDDAGMPSTAVEQPDDDGAGEPAAPPEPDGATAPAEPPDPEAAAEIPGVEPPPVPFAPEPDGSEEAPGSIEPAATATTPTADADTETDAPEETARAGEAEREAPAVTATAPDTDSDAVPGVPDQSAEPVTTPAASAGAGPASDAAPASDTAPASDAESRTDDAAGESASLVIRVREDCWLMIRDAEQRLIYRDLASAGTVLELTAVPPLRIVAGYAEGIEVEYNGELFDLTPYVEQDTGTARFRLGS